MATSGDFNLAIDRALASAGTLPQSGSAGRAGATG